MLARKYGVYLLAVVFLIGIYFYWRSSIYDDGYNAAVAKYEKRDAETERQGQELLKLKQHETDLINKQNAERAFNAAKIYNDHYTRIIADRERMPIRATKTSSCINAMPGASKNTNGTSGAVETVHEPRISEGIIRSIEDGQLACEKLLNLFEVK